MISWRDNKAIKIKKHKAPPTKIQQCTILRASSPFPCNKIFFPPSVLLIEKECMLDVCDMLEMIKVIRFFFWDGWRWLTWISQQFYHLIDVKFCQFCAAVGPIPSHITFLILISLFSLSECFLRAYMDLSIWGCWMDCNVGRIGVER